MLACPSCTSPHDVTWHDITPPACRWSCASPHDVTWHDITSLPPSHLCRIGAPDDAGEKNASIRESRPQVTSPPDLTGPEGKPRPPEGQAPTRAFPEGQTKLLSRRLELLVPRPFARGSGGVAGYSRRMSGPRT